MKITRSFGEYFKYSLHDARVQKIEYADDKLIFTFDYIFSYEHGDEQTHKAKIVFEKCDIDDVNDTLRMYKNDDIRMYNFDCITDTIVEVITTCNTYTLLTVHLL